jgi:hypothetical protein
MGTGFMGVGRERKVDGRSLVVRWLIISLALVLVFSAVWVVTRAIMARDTLLGALPVANRIGSEVLSEGSNISDDLDELQNRASSAAALTSDPIWRAAEVTPFLGENLVAFRQTAALIDDLAQGALPPLSGLAGTFAIDNLKPTDRGFDLSVFEDARPYLGQARAALRIANGEATAIETKNTIPQIGSAVSQVVELVQRAKEAIDGVDTAASLMPSMLGADGQRSYLLLSLNNAELRSTGGLPGAVAVVNATDGALALGALSSASALGELSEPALELTEAERTLYGDLLGTYMHNVNYTPDFARSGELAQAIWEKRTGQSVDGVIAIDPVALGYILEATGPIDAGAGITLTSQNAAGVLLNDVYQRFSDPQEQDAFFAGVTRQIFSAVTASGADAATLVRGLSNGASENRIHIWSAHPEEQVQLESSLVGGAVPTSSNESTAFGVYLNDATGAKMDYYLTGAIAVASGVCRNDEQAVLVGAVRRSFESASVHHRQRGSGRDSGQHKYKRIYLCARRVDRI